MLEKLRFDSVADKIKPQEHLFSIQPCLRQTLHRPPELLWTNKLKDVHAAKVRENNSLKEELLKYQNEVRTLRRGFGENGIYCGRNTTSRWRKKGEWDQTDHMNNDIIKSFCKNKLLPSHKFLGPEQLRYMEDKRSLCFKIYAQIEIPDTIKTHVDKKFYWNQKLVPMINTKLVEVRSNFNSYIKKQYLGMCCLWLTTLHQAKSWNDTQTVNLSIS